LHKRTLSVSPAIIDYTDSTTIVVIIVIILIICYSMEYIHASSFVGDTKRRFSFPGPPQARVSVKNLETSPEESVALEKNGLDS
jgi:hypothetical protein